MSLQPFFDRIDALTPDQVTALQCPARDHLFRQHPDVARNESGVMTLPELAMGGLTPDQQILCATSGGKDSTALALYLRYHAGLSNQITYFFCDTGHEHPLTYGYIERLQVVLGAEIVIIRGPRSWIELAEWKQRFPSSQARFCTEELKVLPTKAWIAREDFSDPVIAVGIRAAESEKRALLPAWDEDNRAYQCPVWRPQLKWSADDVFAVHRWYNVDPNPLYKMGMGRVGCFPCIYVRKRELKRAFEIDPELLPRLRAYEARVEHSIFAPDKAPKRFHDRTHVTKDGRTVTYASIDGIYRWAMDPDSLSLTCSKRTSALVFTGCANETLGKARDNGGRGSLRGIR